MATYYVYENWTHDRARVHLAECSMCNYGKGIHQSDSGRNGKWHGPYVDRDSAFKHATSLRRADTGPCGFCSP